MRKIRKGAGHTAQGASKKKKNRIYKTSFMHTFGPQLIQPYPKKGK